MFLEVGLTAAFVLVNLAMKKEKHLKMASKPLELVDSLRLQLIRIPIQ